MEYKNWLDLNIVRENSGSYYIDVTIDDAELIDELKNNLSMRDIFDTEDIIDEAFEILTDDMILEALKERDKEFYERILNEVIPIENIKDFVIEKEIVKPKLENKVAFDLNETKKFLTETEQQMLLLLIMKAAKEQFNNQIGDAS